MTVVTVSSGIRGGVGKSMLATVLGYTLNYLGSPTLVVDVGGGSTRYVLPEDVPPPYTRDLPRTYNAIVQTTIVTRVARKGLLRRSNTVEKKTAFFITPEVRELTNSEIDGVIGVIPSLEDYFDYVIIDMPAVSNRYYWRFLDVTDVQVVCLVPDRAFAWQILVTTEFRAKKGVVVVVNKYDEKIDEHKRVFDTIWRFLDRKVQRREIVSLSFDSTLSAMSIYGIEALAKLAPSRKTVRSIASLISHIESMGET